MLHFVISYMKQNQKTYTNSRECVVHTGKNLLVFGKMPFSSPEAALVLVSAASGAENGKMLI